MKLFFSGSAADTRPVLGWSEPEVVLNKPDVMLSYWLIKTDGQKQHLRLPRLVKLKRGER